MGGGGEEEGTTLEFTPTWVVACVCTVIVGISLAVERLIHFTGKANSLPLSLDGFISLLLTVFQGSIIKMCVRESVTHQLLPCEFPSESPSEGESSDNTTETTSHLRRLLAEEFTGAGYCAAKDKVPLLSVEALHHLHIFIFVLAIVHVTFSVLTVVIGGAKIRQWKHWEDSIAKDNYDTEQVLRPKLTDVHQHDFIKGRFLGIGKNSAILGWLHSFFKQFYGSVTRSDYMTLRLGFIMTHCRGNPKFNFHKYMIRALEDDFKKVVGNKASDSLNYFFAMHASKKQNNNKEKMKRNSQYWFTI
ncbi:seven transmembrane MLO family protein [Actinidia rufa]|uniref:Seven transmembrane MLO family protein n=1 Tax=Actinidia rufa TaxID=165716 RepID=A0A7J0FL70_9ERIC|nr:seven transmembrane MLO family protein [Actinidia rufa]